MNLKTLLITTKDERAMIDFASGRSNYLEDSFLQRNFPDMLISIEKYHG